MVFRRRHSCCVRRQFSTDFSVRGGAHSADMNSSPVAPPRRMAAYTYLMLHARPPSARPRRFFHFPFLERTLATTFRNHLAPPIDAHSPQVWGRWRYLRSTSGAAHDYALVIWSATVFNWLAICDMRTPRFSLLDRRFPPHPRLPPPPPPSSSVLPTPSSQAQAHVPYLFAA